MRRRRELMARGEPFRLERRMQDGRVFNMNYRPLADGGWITLVEDVTEFKRREYDLRVQFERFEQAVNHMSHGLCAIDSEHRIVLFNRPFLEMYGLSRGRHPGRRLDARRDRLRGGARILPQGDARAGVAAAAGEDGAAQAVPAVSEPAQRQRIHPALSSDATTAAG